MYDWPPTLKLLFLLLSLTPPLIFCTPNSRLKPPCKQLLHLTCYLLESCNTQEASLCSKSKNRKVYIHFLCVSLSSTVYVVCFTVISFYCTIMFISIITHSVFWRSSILKEKNTPDLLRELKAK